MPRRKKLFWILISIIIGVLIIIGALFIWTRYTKAKLSKRQQNLIELPESIDYKNLAPNQLEALFKEIAKKYPNRRTPEDKNGKTYPILQRTTLTRNNQPISSGLTPPKGQVTVGPFQPALPTPSPEKPKGPEPALEPEAPVEEPEQPTEPEEPTEPEKPPVPSFYFTGFSSDYRDLPRIQVELEKIKGIVEKYYPVIVELYGAPYNAENRNIYFFYDEEAGFHGYLPQYDAVVIDVNWPFIILPGLVASFHGDYFSLVPETWEYGMIYGVSQLAVQKLGQDADWFGWLYGYVMSDFEKFNVAQYPIWGSNIFFENDMLLSSDRIALAAVSMTKPYRYDNQFFSKLNQKFYSIPLDSEVWTDSISDWFPFYTDDEDQKVFSQVSSVFPTVEGDSPGSWYETQHVLHQTETNWIILTIMIWGQKFIVEHNGIMVSIFGAGATENGTTFYPKTRSITLKVKNDKGEVIKELPLTTDNSGKIKIGWYCKMEDVGITEDGRYLVEDAQAVEEGSWLEQFSGAGPRTHFAYYKENCLFIYQDELYGAVKNFGQGKITAYGQAGNQLGESAITKGVFRLGSLPAGVIKLEVTDISGNKVTSREVAKGSGGYFALLKSPSPSYPAPGTRGAPAAPEEKCADIDTSNWLTYNKGFSIKYPSDWAYKEHLSGVGATQWFAEFGPKNAASVVWVGGSAKTLEEFKQELTSMEPGFDIIKEEETTIDGEKATKLTVQGRAASYESYIYHILYGNVPPILQGPALSASGQFEKCEPEIFQKMVESYKVARWPIPSQPMGEAQWKTYTNNECQISFDYPPDWAIEEDYYYETAGGSKATIPSILIGKIGAPEGLGSDKIRINIRQSFCMESATSTKEEKSVDGLTMKLFTYPDQNNWCAEALVPGQDNTGKHLDYIFVSYFDDSAVEDIFKGIIKSFRIF